MDSYATFLKAKSLPVYRVQGRTIEVPDEYAHALGKAIKTTGRSIAYKPLPLCFDYQRDIVRMMLDKKKFAVFADCGLGKSLIYFEVLRTLRGLDTDHGWLLFTPSMVVQQMISEWEKFYGTKDIEQVHSGDLSRWLKTCRGKIGITNYESLKHRHDRGQLGGIVADEASIIKHHYGTYGTNLIHLGRGLEWKFTGTGTPAPNDRIEYANHAVFLDKFPTINSFLARYFINRGETQERWVLKPHAIEPFYLSLSEWSIFLSNPATYGWKDNCRTVPAINVYIHDVGMTEDQNRAVMETTGLLVPTRTGGITQRHTMNKISKGCGGVSTNKYTYIRNLVDSWPNESTIIWCWLDAEQKYMEEMFPEAASIKGSTPYEKRLTLIDDFKRGERKVLISKPKVLGFGLNLQIATKQVFSSLIDSYEQYYQAVKRSNRTGSTKPLDVHIPVTEIEIPMVENVLRKARNIQSDTIQQEAIFRKHTTLTGTNHAT
jgi:superfamily II DNA or RNA helicase